MLDGGRSELPSGEAVRLRGRARAVDPIDDAWRWRRWLSRRANVLAYSVDAAALADLLVDNRVVRGASSVQRSALAPGARVMAEGMNEFYVRAEALERLVDEYALVSSERPNLLLRVPAIGWPLSQGLADVPASVEAADLLDAGDSRSVGAGAELLAELQRRWLGDR
jgi:hypothetical protein